MNPNIVATKRLPVGLRKLTPTYRGIGVLVLLWVSVAVFNRLNP
ncbi:hypothetical protein [Pseudoxanthomonas japonensis]|nr:hypothetical protein [Pseudoxanthomonas japonensis]